MQGKDVKFDKTPEDKQLFLSLQEEVSESTIAQPKVQVPEPSSDSCPISQTEPKLEVSNIHAGTQQIMQSVAGLGTCEYCHMTTSEGLTVDGHYFCKQEHYERAKQTGLFKKSQPQLEVKEWKPKETWTQRQAIMKPQHSKMEEALLLKLNEKAIYAVTDKEFCVQSTCPDFYFPEKNLAIYVDGPVHEGKEERDDKIRELLTKRHSIKVIAIPYKDFTEEETEQVFQEIMKNI